MITSLLEADVRERDRQMERRGMLYFVLTFILPILIAAMAQVLSEYFKVRIPFFTHWMLRQIIVFIAVFLVVSAIMRIAARNLRPKLLR